MYSGQFREAIECLDEVLALHSDTPHTVDIMLMWKSVSQFALRQYDEAIATLAGIGGLPYLKNLLLCACYVRAGRMEDARLHKDAILRARPSLRASDLGMVRSAVVELVRFGASVQSEG